MIAGAKRNIYLGNEGLASVDFPETGLAPAQ
jgi:hypothetical protein